MRRQYFDRADGCSYRGAARYANGAGHRLCPETAKTLRRRIKGTAQRTVDTALRKHGVHAFIAISKEPGLSSDAGYAQLTLPIGRLPDTSAIRAIVSDHSAHAPGTSIGLTFFAGAEAEHELLELAFALERRLAGSD